MPSFNKCGLARAIINFLYLVQYNLTLLQHFNTADESPFYPDPNRALNESLLAPQLLPSQCFKATFRTPKIG